MSCGLGKLPRLLMPGCSAPWKGLACWAPLLMPQVGTQAAPGGCCWRLPTQCCLVLLARGRVMGGVLLSSGLLARMGPVQAGPMQAGQYAQCSCGCTSGAMHAGQVTIWCTDSLGLPATNVSLGLLAWPASQPASPGSAVAVHVSHPVPGLHNLTYSLPQVQPCKELGACLCPDLNQAQQGACAQRCSRPQGWALAFPASKQVTAPHACVCVRGSARAHVRFPVMSALGHTPTAAQAGSYLITLTVDGDASSTAWTLPPGLNVSAAGGTQSMPAAPPLPAAIDVLPGLPDPAHCTAIFPEDALSAGMPWRTAQSSACPAPLRLLVPGSTPAAELPRMHIRARHAARCAGEALVLSLQPRDGHGNALLPAALQPPWAGWLRRSSVSHLAEAFAAEAVLRNSSLQVSLPVEHAPGSAHLAASAQLLVAGEYDVQVRLGLTALGPASLRWYQGL